MALQWLIAQEIQQKPIKQLIPVHWQHKSLSHQVEMHLALPLLANQYKTHQ